MTYDLQIQADEFEQVLARNKTFEVAKHSQDYQKGDTIILRELNEENHELTGRFVTRYVSYISTGQDGIQDGYIILGLW